MSLLIVSHLKKVYTSRFGGQSVEALRDVNFTIEDGEFVAIMGESGSGKTTLLNILAALDRPTSGQVILDGRDVASVREKDLTTFRRDNLGFVFQEFNLLDTFTLEDNILLPMVLAGIPYPQMQDALEPIAAKLGILNLLKKYPYEVSGGQKQRSAVARALIMKPRLILADEPTGALIPSPPTSCCGSSAGSTTAVRPYSWSPTPSKPQAVPTGCCSSRMDRYFTNSTGERAPMSSCTSGSPIP